MVVDVGLFVVLTRVRFWWRDCERTITGRRGWWVVAVEMGGGYVWGGERVWLEVVVE